MIALLETNKLEKLLTIQSLKGKQILEFIQK